MAVGVNFATSPPCGPRPTPLPSTLSFHGSGSTSIGPDQATAPPPSSSFHSAAPHQSPELRTSLVVRRSREGRHLEALDLFRDLTHGPAPQPHAFWLAIPSLLRCCVALGAVRSGRELHGFTVRRQSTQLDRLCSESALLSFYAKSGLLPIARDLFDRMLERDVVTWTVMLKAYADSDGHEDEMWELLVRMLRSGILPNQYTITVALCAAAMFRGRQIHSQVVKRNWHLEAFVGGGLVDMYVRNGSLGMAVSVFDRIEQKDEVCFNCLISAYGRSGDAEGLISTFVEMRSAGLEPTQSTYIGMLNGCASLGSFTLSEQLHAAALVSGFSSDRAIDVVLIDMYAKCAALGAARVVFDSTTEKSVLVWNSMISGYGKHGFAKVCLQLFERMKASHVYPDHITFICLLSACSHSGLVHEGLRLFSLMTETYRISPRSEHHCCMVDLMGRAGMIHEAYQYMCSIRGEVSASIWGALLSACRMWGGVEMAEIAAKRLFELEPHCSSSYVALAGMLTLSGKGDDALSVRNQMDEYGIKKDAGSSWIEVDGKVHRFKAGEIINHPSAEDVHFICKLLRSCIGEDYYMQTVIGDVHTFLFV